MVYEIHRNIFDIETKIEMYRQHTYWNTINIQHFIDLVSSLANLLRNVSFCICFVTANIVLKMWTICVYRCETTTKMTSILTPLSKSKFDFCSCFFFFFSSLHIAIDRLKIDGSRQRVAKKVYLPTHIKGYFTIWFAWNTSNYLKAINSI